MKSDPLSLRDVILVSSFKLLQLQESARALRSSGLRTQRLPIYTSSRNAQTWFDLMDQSLPENHGISSCPSAILLAVTTMARTTGGFHQLQRSTFSSRDHDRMAVDSPHRERYVSS